jgi:hypothetical protein
VRAKKALELGRLGPVFPDRNVAHSWRDPGTIQMQDVARFQKQGQPLQVKSPEFALFLRRQISQPTFEFLSVIHAVNRDYGFDVFNLTVIQSQKVFDLLDDHSRLFTMAYSPWQLGRFVKVVTTCRCRQQEDLIRPCLGILLTPPDKLSWIVRIEQ